jgi:pimeloyl-ACP methyl ester carboxylesterase
VVLRSREDQMSRDILLQNLNEAAAGFARVDEGFAVPSARTLRSTRRAQRSRYVSVQLVEVDGLLMWEETTGLPVEVQRFRRGRGTAAAAGEAIAQLEFERLAPSEITSFLVDRDAQLTPRRGLRRWDAAAKKLVPSEAPTSGEVLLLVHGTFSNGDNFIRALQATTHGREFLEKSVNRYNGHVYVFDHPTLSVGPILNAMDLAEAFSRSQAKVDVVAHSRGGLVTRWWCERFDLHQRLCRKAVLVGSPLAGTGLAAPPNLRNTIHLLTQFGNVAGAAVSLATPAVQRPDRPDQRDRRATGVPNASPRPPLGAVALAIPAAQRPDRPDQRGGRVPRAPSTT